MPTAPVSAVRGGWLLWTERAIVYGLVYATSITALKLPDLAMNVHITDSLVGKFSHYRRPRLALNSEQIKRRNYGFFVTEMPPKSDN